MLLLDAVAYVGESLWVWRFRSQLILFWWRCMCMCRTVVPWLIAGMRSCSRDKAAYHTVIYLFPWLIIRNNILEANAGSICSHAFIYASFASLLHNRLVDSVTYLNCQETCDPYNPKRAFHYTLPTDPFQSTTPYCPNLSNPIQYPKPLLLLSSDARIEKH